MDRTEEAYRINNIEIDPEQENNDVPIPPLQSSDGSDSDNGNAELTSSIQSSLWEAVNVVTEWRNG